MHLLARVPPVGLKHMTWLGAPTSRDSRRREGHDASSDGAVQLLPLLTSTLFSFSSVQNVRGPSQYNICFLRLPPSSCALVTFIPERLSPQQSVNGGGAGYTSSTWLPKLLPLSWTSTSASIRFLIIGSSLTLRRL